MTSKQYLLLILLISTIGYAGCASNNNDKCVQALLDKAGVEASIAEAATHLIIIPGNGCSSCIDKVKSGIHTSSDTLYIVVCRSEKEFYLLTSRRLNEFSNVFIDKEAISVEMKMVGTVPIVYTLKNRKFISRMPYTSNDTTNDSIVQTEIVADRTSINWKDLHNTTEQKATFILKNVGENALWITNVELSCDCLNIEYVKREVLPDDTLHLNITLTSEIKGEFIREIYVYGNFPESPLELTVKEE